MIFYTNKSKNNNNNKPVVNIITIIITISLSGFGGMLPRKIFKSQNPKINVISIVLSTKDRVFHSIKVQVLVYRPHNQLLQAMNE